MSTELTQAEIDAAFQQHGCPGKKCEKPRQPDCDPDVWPCTTCPAPKRLRIGNATVYRSYADYCDD